MFLQFITQSFHLMIRKAESQKLAKLGSPGSTLIEMAEIIGDNIGDVPSILLPCTTCNRTFCPDALAKHAKVCEISLKKKRSEFDSMKQRLQGTAFDEYLSLAQTFHNKSDKIQSNQCIYCNRTFGSKAYSRHFVWCKNINKRIRCHSPAIDLARARLKGRTKYKPALINKCRQRWSGSPCPSSRTPTMATAKTVPTGCDKKFKNTPLGSSTRSTLSLCNKKQPPLNSYAVEPADMDLYSAVHTNTMDPDSAYSSLNRKSPVGGEQERGREEGEMALFCHECGTKFLLVAANFCCQCGTKRININY